METHIPVLPCDLVPKCAREYDKNLPFGLDGVIQDPAPTPREKSHAPIPQRASSHVHCGCNCTHATELYSYLSGSVPSFSRGSRHRKLIYIPTAVTVPSSASVKYQILETDCEIARPWNKFESSRFDVGLWKFCCRQNHPD